MRFNRSLATLVLACSIPSAATLAAQQPRSLVNATWRSAAPAYAALPLSDLTTRRVCQQGDPRCPPPDVTVTPNGGTFSTASQSVTVDWCGHAPLDASTEQIVFNGANVTASFSFTASTKAGCSSHASSTGTITLPVGGSTLSATIGDNLSQVGSIGASFTLTGPPPPPPPPPMSIAVTPAP